ncbi:hypothetical protein QFZ77_006936 [Paenibacillus sp. V4I3]|uniref:nucleoside kinase n=1 Tax=Paenibacillus sp. V4I3 TaxID=3042305 RepID=UPI002783893A|nr:nucleoside kinase [Paenibacillus sp. V4I3]MDQ0878277.1 hypothetical protein [Paenibacillus sp. V4I3]
MKAFPAPAKLRSATNCSVAATMPFMVTVNWLIKATRKLVTPTDGFKPEHHIWHVDKVKALVANQEEAVSFFCGGSRNFPKFIDLFDSVFVLEVDLETCLRRIDERVALDPTDWGGRPEEREIIRRLHQTKEGVPKNGIIIDATAPIAHVVDEILHQIEANERQ